MPIRRSGRPSGGYTSLSNALLRRDDLSFEARGMLALMLSHPDDWTFTIDNLVRLSPAGRVVVRRVVGELAAAGFVWWEREQHRGRWSTVMWVSDSPREVSDTPVDDTVVVAPWETGTETPPTGGSSSTAASLAADWLTAAEGRTAQTVEKVSAVAQQALTAGAAPDAVRAALTAIARDGNPVHAVMLTEYLNGTGRGKRRPPVADRRRAPDEYTEDL